MSKKYKYLFSIDCRSVGPGGTSVTFYSEQGTDHIICVWENENCPYDFENLGEPNEVAVAADGHNVSYLSKNDIAAAFADVMGSVGGKKRKPRKSKFKGYTK